MVKVTERVLALPTHRNDSLNVNLMPLLTWQLVNDLQRVAAKKQKMEKKKKN